MIQNNNYYAFGLQTSDSWTRVDTKPNQYLYNRASELNSNTGLYETPLRGYDPALGRFQGVDIMADMYSGFTPYQYADNQPVNKNDPTGAYADDNWWNVPHPSFRGFTDPLQWKREQQLSAMSSSFAGASDKSFFAKPGTLGFNYDSFMFGGHWETQETHSTITLYTGSNTKGDEHNVMADITVSKRVFVADPPAAQQGIPGMSIEWGRNFSSDNSGVDIRLSYKDPDNRFSEYGWIQTVRTNSLHQSEIRRGVRENEPFNDGRGDGAYPNYGGPTCVNCEGFDAIMADHPGRPSNSTYVTWMAEVTIGGIRDGVFVPLGTYTYGFDIIDGKLDVYYPRVTEPTPWHVDSFTNKSKW